MRRPWCLALVLAGLFGLAFAGQDGDELARNRRRLDKWKNDPVAYQRLTRDLEAFFALSAERQEQVRALDRQLHEHDPETETRLWGVMERYVIWMEALPEAERQALQQMPNSDSKLAMIRGLKQREWYDRLPRATRDELSRMPDDKRIARIHQLLLDEQRRRVMWHRAAVGRDDPAPRPFRTSEFPKDVQAFIQRELQPRLSKSDEAQLKRAEGHWPDLPRVIADLADKYPVLPEGPRGPIKSFNDLPAEVKGMLGRAGGKGKGGPKPGWPGHGGPGPRPQPGKWPDFGIHPAQGKWPDYALAVAEQLRFERNLPPLGACQCEELPPAIRDFVQTRLMPVLSMPERDHLERLKGRWPDYPKQLLRLARQHHLVIPGMSLPGPLEMWDAARLANQEMMKPDPDRLKLFTLDKKNGLEWLMNEAKKAQMGGFGGKRKR